MFFGEVVGHEHILYVCSRENEYLYGFCMVSLQGQGISKARGRKQDEKGVSTTSFVDQENNDWKNDPEQKLVDVKELSLDGKQ